MLQELKNDVEKFTRMMNEQNGNSNKKDRKPKVEPKRNSEAENYSNQNEKFTTGIQRQILADRKGIFKTRKGKLLSLETARENISENSLEYTWNTIKVIHVRRERYQENIWINHGWKHCHFDERHKDKHSGNSTLKERWS